MEHWRTFAKTPRSALRLGAKCDGHPVTNHPTFALVDAFAATLPTLHLKPGVHLDDAQSVLPMKGGLPRLEDVPVEFGGSGEIAPE